MGAQEPLVRITLLEAPHDDPAGIVRIPGGQVNYLDSIATHISINPADPAFQQPFNKDENVMAYGRRDGPIEPIDLHQSICFDISMEPGRESSLVPIGVAKINFGDWDIRPGTKSAINPRVTWEVERLRVAMRWGGYELFPFNRIAPNGAPQADTRKIAPPKVPNVRIDVIDQRGIATGESIEPRAFYKFEQLVDRNAAAEATRRLQDVGDTARNPVVAAAPDIDALVKAEVAKQMAAGKKAVASA